MYIWISDLKNGSFIDSGQIALNLQSKVNKVCYIRTIATASGVYN